jgi:cell division protein YceG involved in septum cleavage
MSKSPKLPITPFATIQPRRWLIWVLCLVFTAISLSLIFLLQAKVLTFTNNVSPQPVPTPTTIKPFPVSVDPQSKTITENPDVANFFSTQVASNHTKPAKNETWLALLTDSLLAMDWYQNLASPMSRILVIESGQRAEQVASNFARILGWNATEKSAFLSKMSAVTPRLPDGKFYPGKYVLTSDASPEVAAILIQGKFETDVLSRYTEDIEAKIPLKDTLIIASLIEREAYDFEDMRYISGVIWNRLFIDMRLQIDSTLQYVRGSKPNEPWWPVPVPSDKYLDSPYNTYKNTGLPPGPIASPSIDAIVAALNPRQTDCLFYFHDKQSVFRCSPTYEEHVALLKQYYGRGK